MVRLGRCGSLQYVARRFRRTDREESAVARTQHPRRRYDATQVRLADSFTGIFPYLMKGRNESLVYIPSMIDAGPLLTYIEENKGTEFEISIFEALMICMVKLLRERPNLNRYIAGRRLWQRRDVVISFIARRAYADEAKEVNVQVRVRPGDDVKVLLGQIRGEISSARKGDDQNGDKVISFFFGLPRFALRTAIKALDTWDFFVDTPGFLRGFDPLRCSAYVSNLGSVGLDAQYHHLYEWGNCSIFMAIGKIRKEVAVGPDDTPVVKDIIPLRFTIDERIAEGYYDAKSLDLFRDYLANPELLRAL
jgi:hypothetical protein